MLFFPIVIFFPRKTKNYIDRKKRTTTILETEGLSIPSNLCVFTSICNYLKSYEKTILKDSHVVSIKWKKGFCFTSRLARLRPRTTVPL